MICLIIYLIGYILAFWTGIYDLRKDDGYTTLKHIVWSLIVGIFSYVGVLLVICNSNNFDFYNKKLF